MIPRVIQIACWAIPTNFTQNGKLVNGQFELYALREDGAVFSYDGANNRWSELAPCKRASETAE